MGSSFLTAINLGLGLYCVVTFFRMMIQFGLPNHPARFTLYLVLLSVTSYFVMKSLTGFHLINPFLFMRWRALLLVAGSLGLLLQAITLVGHNSLIQQKIISRLPLMAGLVFFAFFSDYAHFFLGGSVLASVLFLSISVKNARYQKRMLLKMSLFLGIFWLLSLCNQYWLYILAELFLFPALFYLFVFEQSYGVSALVEEFMEDSGVSA